jgi:hypothetical protein
MAARKPATSGAANTSDDTDRSVENMTEKEAVGMTQLGDEQEREVTGKGTFYEDFDNEEYPDAVMPSPGQMIVFDVVSSNVVPIMNKRTKQLEDTEVVQIELVEGTTCTVKFKADDDEEFEDTGEVEPLGETRSLWINSFMLRKIWETWDPQPGDRGALKFKGKVEGRSNEYQKWFGKFDKPMPRQTLTR